jgi:Holliday junction resolvase RusA-like endonuclease
VTIAGAPAQILFVRVPVDVTIVFRIARPGGHWAKRGGVKPSAPTAPHSKPDIDKLARSTLDSLTGIVFDDDSRIVRLTLDKVYAAPGREGASIVVDEWRPASNG